MRSKPVAIPSNLVMKQLAYHTNQLNESMMLLWGTCDRSELSDLRQAYINLKAWVEEEAAKLTRGTVPIKDQETLEYLEDTLNTSLQLFAILEAFRKRRSPKSQGDKTEDALRDMLGVILGHKTNTKPH